MQKLTNSNLFHKQSLKNLKEAEHKSLRHHFATTAKTSNSTLPGPDPKILANSLITHAIHRKKTLESSVAQTFKPVLKSTHRRSWTSVEVPSLILGPVSNYEKSLTEHEKTEIKQYEKVFYVGKGALKNTGCFSDKTGYYIATNKDHLAYRYEIMEVLGQGTFGQVVKCIDHKDQTEVAIKIIRKYPDYHKSGENEVKILSLLAQKKCKTIVQMIDSFEFRGHLCIVFELLSLNLYQLLHKNNFSGFSFSLVRRFTQQILQSLQQIHSSNIIHCDLKPDNILLKLEKKSVIKVIDFGSSCEENKQGLNYVQSRFYRAPEIVIDAKYDRKIDIWSIGCIVVEFITGQPLFEAGDEVELFRRFVEVLGCPSAEFMSSGRRSKFYVDKAGKLKFKGNGEGKGISEVLAGVEDVIADFVEKCLAWEPEKRMSVEQALAHPWIKGGLRSGRSSVDLDEHR